MKRYSLLFLMCLYVGILNAQLVNQDDQTAKKQSDLDWYNCSFDKDGVYGAEVNKAYEFLKGKIKISFNRNRIGCGTRRFETSDLV